MSRSRVCRVAGVAAALCAVLAVTVGLPARASAQDVGEQLEQAARDFAREWQEGRVDLLAARLGREGIRLHLPEGSHPAVSVRLARAALEDLHGGVGVGPVEVRQIRLLGGDPARGFLEMSWTPHPSGTSEAMAFTVFTGLERRDAEWWVVEVRVLERDGGRGPGGADDGAPHARGERRTEDASDNRTDDPWR